MSKINELSFSIKKESMSQLIDVLKDLSKLNDKVLLKIDKKNTLIYSTVGNGNAINAFKNFIFKTDDIFKGMGDFDETIHFIIKSGKQMCNTLRIIASFDSDVTGKIFFDSVGTTVYADRLYLKVGSKLRQNFYGGDPRSMNININISDIKKIANVENADYSFDLESDDFDKIKKLSSSEDVINIYYLNVYEKNEKFYISVGEGPWDITVAETEYNRPCSLAFPKKYFKSINLVNKTVKIHVFDNMILAVTENSNLLISVEITV